MSIPTEIVAVMFTAILGLQGWILKEIVALKVKTAAKDVRVEELEKRVDKLEAAATAHSAQ